MLSNWWISPAHFARLAGIEALETGDGRDLGPLLAGEGGDGERIGVTEFAWSKSVRKGQYRLVHYPRAMFADEYPGGLRRAIRFGGRPLGDAQSIL